MDICIETHRKIVKQLSQLLETREYCYENSTDESKRERYHSDIIAVRYAINTLIGRENNKETIFEFEPVEEHNNLSIDDFPGEMPEEIKELYRQKEPTLRIDYSMN